MKNLIPLMTQLHDLEIAGKKLQDSIELVHRTGMAVKSEVNEAFSKVARENTEVLKQLSCAKKDRKDAIREAIEPFKKEISTLKARIQSLEEENAALKSKAEEKAS